MNLPVALQNLLSGKSEAVAIAPAGIRTISGLTCCRKGNVDEVLLP